MSTFARSCKNRFSTAPAGVASKNRIGASNTAESIFPCKIVDAPKAQSVSAMVCKHNTTAWTRPMPT